MEPPISEPIPITEPAAAIIAAWRGEGVLVIDLTLSEGGPSQFND